MSVMRAAQLTACYLLAVLVALTLGAFTAMVLACLGLWVPWA